MAKNEPKQQEQPAAQAPVGAALTLTELAMKHGKTFHHAGKDGKLYPSVPSHDSVLKAEHLQADVLHGWTKHERHTSESIKLSDDDYLAALDAAKTGKVHAPANKRG